jgi:glycosyltransferase involved in cell wall biosynthesis
LTYFDEPAVTVVGEVPSVLPYLCNADVAVVPLKFESGTRFKILEAGACGVPIVSTTLGAEGLPVEHGRHVLIADSPTEFAAAVASILADEVLAGSIARACKELVRENFSLRRLAAQAEQIIEALA